MTEQLQIKYVRLDELRRWDRNPKRHDLGAIADSIARHGFKDPPRYEPALNGGEGGIVAGNGRVETLGFMHEQGRDVPRGLLLDERDSMWLVPVLFGVDAPSQAAAEAYGVDHNALVLLGGDFDAIDLSRLWDGDEYRALIESLAELDELPVTVDADDVERVLQPFSTPTPPPQQEPTLRAECFVEIYCGREQLDAMRETLERWGMIDGVTINIQG